MGKDRCPFILATLHTADEISPAVKPGETFEVSCVRPCYDGMPRCGAGIKIKKDLQGIVSYEPFGDCFEQIKVR